MEASTSTSQAALQSHKHWARIQTLDPELAIFLEPDVDFSRRKCTKEKLQDVMKHFGVAAEHRPRNAKKDELVDAFKTHLQPELEPFVKQKDHVVKEKTGEKQKKAEKKNQARHLNPATSSLEELRSAIITRIRAVMVAPAFSKTALIRLWKHVFNRTQDPLSSFTSRPDFFPSHELAKKKRDELRYAIQCEFPELFIPLAACTEPILRALYERFVLDNEDLVSELCEGVHYFIIPEAGQQNDEDDENSDDNDNHTQSEMSSDHSHEHPGDQVGEGHVGNQGDEVIMDSAGDELL